ncbi:MAG: hypothetical protein ACXW5U_07300 [Thermoanaerobaculia bacterium]
MKAYERLTEQERALASWLGTTEASLTKIETAVTEWECPPFPADSTRTESAAAEVISAGVRAEEAVAQSRRSMFDAIATVRSALEGAVAATGADQWAGHSAGIKAAYAKAVAGSGADDGMSSHRELLERIRELEEDLGELDAVEKELTSVRDEAREAAEALLSARTTLTERRRSFVKKLACDDARVQIEIQAFGDYRDAEFRLRAIIGKPDTTFQDQIWSDEDTTGILYDLYQNGSGAEDLLGGLEKLKLRLTAAAEGTADDLHGKFVAHLRKLAPEALNRIATLYPEDAVSVTYRSSASSKDLRPIEQGSPGQKSAAMLAFILSYGTEPLILDQPEDDLDGHLISELIVEELRRNKSHRQMIVVTHNSNIVVNGDAELILPFEVGSGQTRVVGDGGGLQERAVRDEICRVMEGGRDALERRYRRIQAAS